MGRPLNKKYFGNNNTPPIGGEGISGINWSTLGSFSGNAGVAPITIPALPAPTLPGVQATWTMLFEVESVFTGAGKTGLAVGDTFGVASIPGMIAKVTDTSGANAIWSVTTTGASRGDPLELADIPTDTVGITLSKIAGTGSATTFFVDILFRIRQDTVTITNAGSGYNGTETFTFTKPGTTLGTVPAGTIILTGAKQNAIVAYAYVGGGVEVVDIAKQTRSRGYNVVGASGSVNNAMLTGATASADGEMNISAVDSNGGEYWVMKLTNGNALVKQKGAGPWEFADMTEVSWTFAAEPRPAPLDAGVNVKIDNA